MGCGTSRTAVERITEPLSEESEEAVEHPIGEEKVTNSLTQPNLEASGEKYDILSSYLPRTLVNHYLKKKKAPSRVTHKKMKIAILFVDISGFSVN